MTLLCTSSAWSWHTCDMHWLCSCGHVADRFTLVRLALIIRQVGETVDQSAIAIARCLCVVMMIMGFQYYPILSDTVRYYTILNTVYLVSWACSLVLRKALWRRSACLSHDHVQCASRLLLSYQTIFDQHSATATGGILVSCIEIIHDFEVIGAKPVLLAGQPALSGTTAMAAPSDVQSNKRV